MHIIVWNTIHIPSKVSQQDNGIYVCFFHVFYKVLYCENSKTRFNHDFHDHNALKSNPVRSLKDKSVAKVFMTAFHKVKPFVLCFNQNWVIKRVRISCSQIKFAKRFSSLPMSFCIFPKNCKSLTSDTSLIFRVIYWTRYIVNYFKPIKYPQLNNNVILQRFIVHNNFNLHNSFFSKYHFVTI